MTHEIRGTLRQRLANQKLVGSDLNDPSAVVAWLGAVQAQDLPAARWAVGLRARGLTDAAVERAYDNGSILRTHVLRPTWHLVTPEDLRWMIALTGPRIAAKLSHRRRHLEIDDQTLGRSRTVLVRSLARHRYRTRAELRTALERAGVHVTPERLTHLIVQAETEGLICSGPMRGARITYALLDERVPPAPPLERDEALGRLADRYFRSRAPATAADFAWWSGLPLGEARRAAEIADPALSRAAARAAARRGRPPVRARRDDPSAWLLPNFDEYLVAYKDRAAILDTSVDPRDALMHTVIVDGRAAGVWRQDRRNGGVSIVIVPRRRLTGEDLARIRIAAERYARFLERPVTVSAGTNREPRATARL